MASMDSRSSWGPQPFALPFPSPPMAQLPKPIVVSSDPSEPSLRVSIHILPSVTSLSVTPSQEPYRSRTKLGQPLRKDTMHVDDDGNRPSRKPSARISRVFGAGTRPRPGVGAHEGVVSLWDRPPGDLSSHR